ncbi:MAG: methylated-DNA--[protein]-cysteine S-methyltransferase [Actinomycetota bacterium]
MHRTNTVLPLGDHKALVRRTMTTPVGELTLVAGPRGLRAVLWHGELPDDTDIAAADETGRAASSRTTSSRAASILAEAMLQLDEYFAGTRTDFELPLDPVGTEFQQAAWMELRKIPFGGTISYGEQARRLGDANKSRAVGAANGRNPLSIVVPCHRVIGANGSLIGFAAGIDIKQWLLQHEQRGAGQGRLTLA